MMYKIIVEKEKQVVPVNPLIKILSHGNWPMLGTMAKKIDLFIIIAEWKGKHF